MQYQRCSFQTNSKFSMEALRSTFRTSYRTSFRSSVPTLLPINYKKYESRTDFQSKPNPSIPSLRACKSSVVLKIKNQFSEIQKILKDTKQMLVETAGIQEQNPWSYSEQHRTSVIQFIEDLNQDFEESKKIVNQKRENDSDRLAYMRRKKLADCAFISNIYFVGPLLKPKEELELRRKEHIHISMLILKKYASFLPKWEEEFASQAKSLIRYDSDRGKKTLVIDLDQTIVHCSEQLKDIKDIRVQFSENQIKQSDVIFLSIRPYAMSFLRQMAQIYELVVFTASLQSYADPVLDEIDCDRKLFKHRLYRDSCVRIDRNLYIKDLRVLGRALKDVILVDNSAFSTLFQLDNAVPILSYYEGEDTELLSLLKYLKQLAKWGDIRDCNRSTFRLHEYIECENPYDIVQSLYLSSDYMHLQKGGARL